MWVLFFYYSFPICFVLSWHHRFNPLCVDCLLVFPPPNNNKTKKQQQNTTDKSSMCSCFFFFFQEVNFISNLAENSPSHLVSGLILLGLSFLLLKTVLILTSSGRWEHQCLAANPAKIPGWKVIGKDSSNLDEQLLEKSSPQAIARLQAPRSCCELWFYFASVYLHACCVSGVLALET